MRPARRARVVARTARRPRGATRPRRRRAGSRGRPAGPAGRRLDEDLDIDPPLARRRRGRPGRGDPRLRRRRRRRRGAGRRARLAGRRRARRRCGRARGRPGAPLPRRARRRPAAGRSTTPSGAIPAARPGDCSLAPRGCRISRPASPSRPCCRRAGSSCPRDGSAVVTDFGVTFGAAESVLERRAEVARLAGEAERLDAEVGEPARRPRAAWPPAAQATRPSAVEAARADESRAERARRAAEEAERLAARRLETVVREAAWHEAQAERLAAELERARRRRRGARTDRGRRLDRRADATTTEPGVRDGRPRWRPGRPVPPSCGHGAIAWPRSSAARDATRRDAENRRAACRGVDAPCRGADGARRTRARDARSSASAASAEERDALRDRDRRGRPPAKLPRARRSRAIHAADAADRDRLGQAERDATAARERLRARRRAAACGRSRRARGAARPRGAPRGDRRRAGGARRVRDRASRAAGVEPWIGTPSDAARRACRHGDRRSRGRGRRLRGGRRARGRARALVDADLGCRAADRARPEPRPARAAAAALPRARCGQSVRGRRVRRASATRLETLETQAADLARPRSRGRAT